MKPRQNITIIGLCFLFFSLPIYAMSKNTITGIIKDSRNGKGIKNAKIIYQSLIDRNIAYGAVTDSKGRYVLVDVFEKAG